MCGLRFLMHTKGKEFCMYNLFVAYAIMADQKRMDRIKAAGVNMRSKANRYVVAECQRQHVRLSKKEVGETASYIVYHGGKK